MRDDIWPVIQEQTQNHQTLGKNGGLRWQKRNYF